MLGLKFLVLLKITMGLSLTVSVLWSHQHCVTFTDTQTTDRHARSDKGEAADGVAIEM
jgi:hypothetical protein